MGIGMGGGCSTSLLLDASRITLSPQNRSMALPCREVPTAYSTYSPPW
jgi:hypothetical protein